MKTYTLEKPDAMVSSIVAASFPSYRGRKFRLSVTDSINVQSYWSGGSRDYFSFVRLTDMANIPVPAQSGFDRQIPGADSVSLPDGVVCVEHSIFCGKDHGITIHANSATLAPMLPAPGSLSWAETVVLYATRSLKSSYAGVSDYRRKEAMEDTGISNDEYSAAKAALIDGKYLNKAGAITPKGKNAYDGFSWPKKDAA